MKRLVAFESKPTAISIDARFSVVNDGIEIEFRVNDPELATLDALLSGTFSGHDLTRTNRLWQTTCFEAFWGTQDDSRYWELNLSAATPQWNLFKFDAYRVPAATQPCEDFRLKLLARTQQTLLCQLETDSPGCLSNLQSSLCAVIRTHSETLHFSEKHAGQKADFHDRRAWLPVETLHT